MMITVKFIMKTKYRYRFEKGIVTKKLDFFEIIYFMIIITVKFTMKTKRKYRFEKICKNYIKSNNTRKLVRNRNWIET